MNKTDKAVQMYCEMMIETIKGLKEGWRKTWLTVQGFGKPTNADGRAYNSMNLFFLWLVAESKGYQYPVFVTYNKTKQMGAHVKKGEHSFPVLLWKIIGRDKDGKLVEPKDPACEKSYPVLRSFDVFNIDQTTIPEDCPAFMEKMSKRYNVPELHGEDGMYKNDTMDALIGGGWCCPIRLEKQDRAYYSQATDKITLPTKEQFNDGKNAYEGGMEFYSTALHEMAHSTGAKSRLDRLTLSSFGSDEYGREELVAELTAAICGHELGFNAGVQANNAAYLSGWLKMIKKEPKFLVSVLSDVSKAVGMIHEAMEKVG